MNIRLAQDFVKLDPNTHVYSDDLGNVYDSISKILKSITPPFPRDRIASAIAKRDGKKKEDILKEWDDKMYSSLVHGNKIHDSLEVYDKTGNVVDPYLNDMILGVNSIFNNYEETYSEARLFLKKYRIAGTADKPCYRGKNVMDIFDYKTNESQGIKYHNKYGKYLLNPLDHLEDCNYNKYSLQLSSYAYMIEKEFGFKVGMLKIIFIPPSNPVGWFQIPVPYMREEVKILFDWYRKSNPVKESVVSQSQWE